MANAAFTKGCAVEVSSGEPGLEGAWYAATFVDEVEAPPTGKRASNKRKRNVKKSRYLVKYDTLFEEGNFLEPLTERVDPSFVRPLPPRNIRRNDDDKVKEAEVEEGDGDGDFELHDVIDAYHRDGWWIGVVKNVIIEGELRKYIVAFENPPEEFEFERSKLRLHVDWIDCRWLLPPKKTLLSDRHEGFTTPSKGGGRIAKKNSPRKRSECNSAMAASVTYSRKKRIVNLVDGKKFQSSSGSNNNAQVIVSNLETSGHEDSPPVEHGIIIRQTHVEDGKSHQKKKRGRSRKLGPIGLLRDGPGVTAGINEQPLSVCYPGMRPLSVLKRSSCFSPPDHHDNSLNQGIVTHSTDYQQDWPFIKRSPIWDAIELCITPPQKPHFLPLKKMKYYCREGLAIAQMVTFVKLFQRSLDLQVKDPVGMINDSLDTLCELETHGFEVGSIRDRLHELLSLKSKICCHEDKRIEVEKELEKCHHEMRLVEKEMDELEAKMQLLKERTAQTATMRKAKEEEMLRLQSNLHLVSDQMNDWQLTFEKLVATPL